MSCHVRGNSCFRRSFSISRKQSRMFPWYLLSKPSILPRPTFKFRPKLITFPIDIDDRTFKICGKSLSDSSIGLGVAIAIPKI